MANVTYLDNVDDTRVKDLMGSTNKNVEYFTNILDEIVTAHVSNLDSIMKAFYLKHRDYKKANLDIPIKDLENMYLELANTLYFAGDKLESLGIHNDMSKAAKQEVYNKAYLDNQIKDTDKKNKTTVAENAAVAEQSAQYESVVNSIYERAYKMVKYKIDAGYEVLNTLRKLISRRMQEVDLSNSYRQPNTGFIKSDEA